MKKNIGTANLDEARSYLIVDSATGLVMLKKRKEITPNINAIGNIILIINLNKLKFFSNPSPIKITKDINTPGTYVVSIFL